MLALLVQVPDLITRIKQGGIVGMIIIFLALAGVIIALERFYVLSVIDRKVVSQMKDKQPGENPLGRIMKIFMDNPDIDSDTLGLKLDEAILKELPPLRRGLGTLALLAAIAPLLGLLGTVTGIIDTFQAITLFGTGDPRVMSGGISQALVTTVMGLVAAIPLLLLHSFLSTKSNRLIHILDENSAAFVAQLAESHKS
jgi:biopolymer transport protein ExbB